MTIQYLDHEKVLSRLPDRAENAHKGCFGKILMLCGSRGYTGAAALSAMAAMRSGAGLVYLGVPECIYEIEAARLLEPIVFPLPDENGTYSVAAVSELEQHLCGKNAVLIGPGLGKSEGVLSVVQYVMENYAGPVVLDADGINVLALRKHIIADRNAPTIITPHKGEFERLGITVDDSESGRITAAEIMARELDAIVLLKGHRTVITDGVNCFINNTGNPGLAVGGSGDVLSGIIVALLGQGLAPLEAAACGAWLHGKAGDICATEIGQYGMLPSDVIQALPRLLK